ncbi:MAG: hypothetical protein KatS3mg011_2072 [Acidimicrobiia bacterium]|nr:MAG: hypothetical protein KatS3mg011_2072 [Acidimicrobiia bacterium]
MEQAQEAGPLSRLDPRVENRIRAVGRWVRRLTALGAVVTAGSAVMGWGGLRSEGPGSVGRGSVFILVGLACLTVGAVLTTDKGGRPVLRLAGKTLCVLSGVYALYLMSSLLGVTGWLWPVPLGEMPAFSAEAGLVGLSAGALLVGQRDSRRVVAGQICCLVVFSLMAVTLVAYAAGDPAIGRLVLGPPISLQEALVTLGASVGILLAQPGVGLVAAASSPGWGGAVLRRFGPVVLLVPALLILLAQARPANERVSLLAFVAVGLGLFLVVMLATLVSWIDRATREAAEAAATAERARAALRQAAPLVENVADVLHLLEVDPDPNWQVATRYRPATGVVTGDASAVVSLGPDRLGVVLVDVAGHGAEAAVAAVRIRDGLAAALAAGSSPAGCLATVERLMSGSALSSAVVIEIVKDRGEAHIASAGHPPLVLVADGAVQMVEATGPLLFMGADSGGERLVGLPPGATLVAFSDGVADVQIDEGGAAQPERLADMLVDRSTDAEEVADLVVGFADPEVNDDQTVVVVRRCG